MKFNADYWEQRYKTGGTSGKGSVGLYRAWKWRIIESYLHEPVHRTTFIDYGCGDHSFWKGRTPRSYVGLDKSRTIIERNRSKWPRHDWKVWDIVKPIPEHEGFDAAFVMDVLFHVESLQDARTILANAGATAEFVFARNWNRDHREGRPDEYQSYHDNADLIGAIPTHAFVAAHPNPWYTDNASSLLVWQRRLHQSKGGGNNQT